MTSTSKRAGPQVMTGVFVTLIAGAVLYAGGNGTMDKVSEASFVAAKDGVNLALNLIGIMGLWLGLMRVLEVGGLMRSLAHALVPLAKRLFPDVPAGHPAMSAMLLNISANMLGLGNAATPFGLKAMTELAKLAPTPGTATNAMCLFLAINTSSVTLLPLGVIGLRAAAGSVDPAGIILPSLCATICSTISAIVLTQFFAHRDFKRHQTNLVGVTTEPDLSSPEPEEPQPGADLHPTPSGRIFAVLIPALLFLIFGARLLTQDEPLKFLTTEVMSHWLMPCLMVLILCYGLGRGVKVYEAVTEGAKEGFHIAVRIIPFLVAILVAVGMFRASGAMELLVSFLNPLTSLVGMPAEALPMALIRPLSGSGAFAVLSATVKEAPDSYLSYVVSVMQGSTETTFYVLAVYFGSIGVTRIRYTLIVALLADVVGLVSACWWSALFWRG